jgi:iron complex outermembrane recepter protein
MTGLQAPIDTTTAGRMTSPRLGLAALAITIAMLLPTIPLAAQQAAAGAIEGTVQADEGPVRGALVRIAGTQAGAVTDAEGRFRLDRVPPGEVRLRVEAVGHRPVERAIPADDRMAPVTIDLESDPVALRGVIATATPLRGGIGYQPARALDGEALQRRAAVSFGQMLDGEPGVAMRSMGPAPARPVIRGLDGDRIAVLENGQRMGDISETAPDHAIGMDPLTADRVEVVRGPASLLHGSSALGGVVNLLRDDIPRSWASGTRGSASLQGATVNREGAVAARGVTGGDRWAGTGRFAYRGGGDFRTPGTPEGQLLGTHSRRFSAGAGMGYAGEVLRGGLAIDLLGHDFGIPEEIDDPDEEVEIRSARQRLSGELDWGGEGIWDRFELRAAATRFFQQEIEREWEPDGTYDEDVEHEFTRHTLSATLTAGHRPLGPLAEGAVGISVLAQTLAATGEEEFHPDARSLSAAAFLFEEIPVTPRFRLQGGARVEAQSIEARPNETFPHLHHTRTGVTVSGSVGANLRPAEGLELGVQLARAHRAPLVEELYSDGPHLGTGRYEIGNRNLVNEIGHGADLFGRWTGDRVAVEIAGFVNRIENFVILRGTGEVDAASGFPVHVYEADAAELLGGEIALELRPAEGLTMRGTGDVVRGSRRDADRTPLPYMPPARATVEVEYDTGPAWVGVRSRTAAAQHRVADEAPTDGYTLLDLQSGLRVPGGGVQHTLVLRIDNLLDTAYRDHLSRVEDRRFPMPGRNISLAYRWQF